MSERLYVVISRFNDGKWAIADFSNLPFASTNWHDAHKMRRAIEEHFDAVRSYRKYKKCRVVKAVVTP